MKKYKYRVIKQFGLEREGRNITIFNTHRNDRGFYKKGDNYYDYDIAGMTQHPITQELLNTNRITKI